MTLTEKCRDDDTHFVTIGNTCLGMASPPPPAPRPLMLKYKYLYKDVILTEFLLRLDTCLLGTAYCLLLPEMNQCVFQIVSQTARNVKTRLGDTKLLQK